MRKALLLAVLSALALSFMFQIGAWSQAAALASPPVAPVRPVIDDYFGTKVTDPYRYMENLSDPEVKAWMEAPFFWTGLIAFYKRGGIFATCQVRGGGEFGEEWHRAGPLATTPMRRALTAPDSMSETPA
jgi:hypothetical protein